MNILNFFFKKESIYCSDNTFFVWEPCTYSHSEVVPAYAKYLLDLGFEVSVLVTPERYKEGLFSRFANYGDKVHFNKVSQRQIKKYFKKNGLGKSRGIILTTSGKLAEPADYQREFDFFKKSNDSQKILIVEHDVKKGVDCGSLTSDIVTLRKPDYKGAQTTVINPHFFGDVNITSKNADIVNFITVGALRDKRRNVDMLVNAVAHLVNSGIENFKITCIGKGSIKHIPQNLRRFFDMKGQADFSEMYTEMEKADFFLPLLDSQNLAHDRYITTGTSGSFQLIFGFAKPCVIENKFAKINDFNSENAVLYNSAEELGFAMEHAIKMMPSEYEITQKNLINTAANIYNKSLENLKESIDVK